MAISRHLAGDRVGCLVTVEGQLQIFVNGKWRLDGPKNVDTRALDRTVQRNRGLLYGGFRMAPDGGLYHRFDRAYNHQNIGLPPVIHLNSVYKHYKTSS